jgi:murein DD-endopeptidase MepM/ murein hydrolase activator NlpD
MKIYRALKTDWKTQGYGKDGTIPGMIPAYNKMGLNYHNGVDWACYLKEPIYWNFDRRGIVNYTQNDLNAGVGVDVLVTYPEGAYKVQMWHFAMDGLVVKAGDVLESGQLIGYGNSTGFSTGNHLHFGMKPQLIGPDGNYYTPNKDDGMLGCIDPMPFYENVFIVDLMNNLQAQVGILQKIINLILAFLKAEK